MYNLGHYSRFFSRQEDFSRTAPRKLRGDIPDSLDWRDYGAVMEV